MPIEIPWIIFLLPLASFAIISFILRPFFKERPRLAGYLTVGAIGVDVLLSLWVLTAVMGAKDHVIPLPDYNWLSIGNLRIHLGVTVDSLTAVMLLVVTGVSFLVQFYSQGYMHGDGGYHRYFAFMSLFTASMLGLVLADNLLMLYVFWELVGLCSYLLIGFWFHRPAAASAAKKAFIVTRIGDFGFLIAILILFLNTGTFDIGQLQALAAAGALGGAVLTWAAIGIFAGAAGKSAQFPLHVWLPDAMEGPTPVSALIHAATMVAAGVYLVARLFPMFAHSPEAMSTVAIIGGFTAFFAATMGLVMNDMKRVMAYSTISQLGYMMLALGVGGYVAGVFHLMNHAFFKALLFLCAGSVNHATGTFDMREMGGLRKVMPWTFAATLIGALSLAGLPPFSGFWSKDEILADVWGKNPVLFLLASVTVFMTAFYSFRMIFMAFGGTYRGTPAAAHGGGHSGGHAPSLHESPAVMVFPLVVLSVPAIISGFVNPPPFLSFLGIPAHWLSDFLKTPQVAAALGEHEAEAFNPMLAGISVALGGLGIFLAYAIYSARWLSAEAIGKAFAPIYRMLINKYWLDYLYEQLLVMNFLIRSLFYAVQWFDTYIVDGAVNGTAWVAASLGGTLRRMQTGQPQVYGLAIVVGVLAMLIALLIYRLVM